MSAEDTIRSINNAMQSDLLMLAFNQACSGGELSVASSLLQQLDGLLLGNAMSRAEREISLKRVRRLRDRLEKLRADGGAEHKSRLRVPDQHMLTSESRVSAR